MRSLILALALMVAMAMPSPAHAQAGVTGLVVESYRLCAPKSLARAIT